MQVYNTTWASLVAQMVKKLPVMRETWVGKIPWRRACQPTQYSCLEHPQGQRSLTGYSPWGHKGSDTTEQLTHTRTHTHTHTEEMGRGFQWDSLPWRTRKKLYNSQHKNVTLWRRKMKRGAWSPPLPLPGGMVHARADAGGAQSLSITGSWRHRTRSVELRAVCGAGKGDNTDKLSP